MLSSIRPGVKEDLTGVIQEELDRRDIGGVGYVQSQQLMAKIDLVLHNQTNVTTNTETENETEHPIFIVEEETPHTIDNGVSNSTNATVSVTQTQEQLRRRQSSCGFHHGLLNPLPSSWVFPPSLPIILMMNMWLCGDVVMNVPPLRCITSHNVRHIKNGQNKLSKMKRVMGVIERFGRNRSVWHDNAQYWNGARVTTLWTSTWNDLSPYLKGQGNSPEISRTGQISFRSVYNNMQERGLFFVPGRVVRRRRPTSNNIVNLEDV